MRQKGINHVTVCKNANGICICIVEYWNVGRKLTVKHYDHVPKSVAEVLPHMYVQYITTHKQRKEIQYGLVPYPRYIIPVNDGQPYIAEDDCICKVICSNSTYSTTIYTNSQ